MDCGVDDAEPFRESSTKENTPVPASLQPGHEREEAQDVKYWKRECQKARRLAEETKAEADSFLQCYTELEEIAQEKEREQHDSKLRFQTLEYQFQAAEREARRWQSEFEKLKTQTETERDNRSAVQLKNVSAQVWETELECEFGVLASVVDAAQQTEEPEKQASQRIAKNEAFNEVEQFLVTCLDDVRENSAFLVDLCSRASQAEEPSPKSQPVAESSFAKALKWEHDQQQRQVEDLKEEEKRLSSMIEKRKEELERTEQEYRVMVSQYERYVQEVDEQFTRHSAELDTLSSLTEKFDAFSRVQRSRAEYFMKRAHVQKGMLIACCERQGTEKQNENGGEYSGRMADPNRCSETVEVDGNKNFDNMDLELLERDHKDQRRVSILSAAQHQLLFEKEAMIYHLKAKVRELKLCGKERREEADCPRQSLRMELSDEATADLESLEMQIGDGVERVTFLSNELLELARQKANAEIEIQKSTQQNQVIQTEVEVGCLFRRANHKCDQETARTLAALAKSVESRKQEESSLLLEVERTREAVDEVVAELHGKKRLLEQLQRREEDLNLRRREQVAQPYNQPLLHRVPQQERKMIDDLHIRESREATAKQSKTKLELVDEELQSRVLKLLSVEEAIANQEEKLRSLETQSKRYSEDSRVHFEKLQVLKQELRRCEALTDEKATLGEELEELNREIAAARDDLQNTQTEHARLNQDVENLRRRREEVSNPVLHETLDQGASEGVPWGEVGADGGNLALQGIAVASDGEIRGQICRLIEDAKSVSDGVPSPLSSADCDRNS